MYAMSTAVRSEQGGIRRGKCVPEVCSSVAMASVSQLCELSLSHAPGSSKLWESKSVYLGSCTKKLKSGQREYVIAAFCPFFQPPIELL